ncbi:UDP-glycosyltransferase 73C3-like [Phragmites australis]|uniref:UDP-glycosyltransferase 73C3-like n=1 Tax=Phragmites australis TaxID=29695 RepID=UPI002D76B6FD|nr:UDP-glycosyltransferase 73C3-like [Phragmites australis]
MAPTQESTATMLVPPPPPHFVIVPLVAQGHTIPMVDFARLLAERGACVSLITTPVNGARLRGVAEQAARAKLSLEFVELPFPTDFDGLPPGIENVDQVTDNNHFVPLFEALRKLAGPLEAYLRAQAPRQSCIISDWCNPWTAVVARRLGIPRLFFHGPSCFYSLCDLNAVDHGLHQQTAAADDHEKFVVPGMPVHVEVTKATAPGFLNSPGWEALWAEADEAMRTADGAVVNTFLDLEDQFVACYEAALGKPVWTLGPFCLSNRDADAMASRGNKLDIQQSAVTVWLDTMDTDSVVYVSFGSLARKLPKLLFEVGHGLEDSGKPFIWVVKETEADAPEVQEWLEALEVRTAGRGLVVRGWAPQLAILSHRAVGGFVTHCGWNSLLESIAHGVPLVTWPHFADQFLNERLVVGVLGVGVAVGVTAPVMIFDDEAVQVARGDIVRAVSALMGVEEEADERRRKAKKYGEKAHRAMEKGGSSYENLTQLIESFRQSGGKEG